MIAETILLIGCGLFLVWMATNPWVKEQEQKVCSKHGECHDGMNHCPTCGDRLETETEEPLWTQILNRIEETYDAVDRIHENNHWADLDPDAREYHLKKEAWKEVFEEDRAEEHKMEFEVETE